MENKKIGDVAKRHQVSLSTDHNARRRAIVMIAVLYGAAAVGNLIYWCDK